MKNPVLEKKRQEGYTDGFNKGYELGKAHALKVSEQVVNKLVVDLKNVDGIGDKTYQKILKGMKLSVDDR